MKILTSTILLFFMTAVTTAAVADNENQSEFYTESYQKSALDIYRNIIAIRSVEGYGKVPEVAHYLAKQFKEGGFSTEDVNVLPFTSAKGEEVASLVVRFRGDGSAKKKPILLIAHMDVVEAFPKDWQRDPYTLIEEDGYFFGRGTVDNKNGVAMLTSTFLRLKAENFIPTRDLIIAFTGDEESDMKSAQLLVTEHRSLIDAEFALNSDDGGGTLDDNNVAVSYAMAAAEKTYASFTFTARNAGGHSSMPTVDNAIYDLAKALNKLDAYKFPVRQTDITQKYFAETAKVTKGPTGEAMRKFAINANDKEATEHLNNQSSYVGMTRTTCVATMLTGGHAENALPQSATATVNCRIFPGVEAAEIKEKLQSIVGKAIEINLLGDPKMSLSSPLRKDVMQAVTKAVNSTYADVAIIPTMVPWATDGTALRAAGIPTYGVTGMFLRKQDDFSHGLNERAPVKSFYSSLDHWYILLKELSDH